MFDTVKVHSQKCNRAAAIKRVRYCVSKQIWQLTSTDTIKLIMDGEKGGKGYGGGGDDDELMLNVLRCHLTY